MKRRLDTPKAIKTGKAAQPEARKRIKDPGTAAASAKVKKQEPDVFPTRKVPDKGRPTKGGSAKYEKLLDKRI
jgi:hypothetical protein